MIYLFKLIGILSKITYRQNVDNSLKKGIQLSNSKIHDNTHCHPLLHRKVIFLILLRFNHSNALIQLRPVICWAVSISYIYWLSNRSLNKFASGNDALFQGFPFC